jgi:hypothetical protein
MVKLRMVPVEASRDLNYVTPAGLQFLLQEQGKIHFSDKT